MRERRAQVLVVGAGPAGLAAAVAASRSGAQVTLLDQHDALGGQIWRPRLGRDFPRAARRWIALLQRSGCTFLPGRRVYADDGDALLVQSADGVERITFERSILATGARELLLPFAGWTLPGVSGAGGLQALVKGGWPIRGRRVVIAGSGPLLLATAATVRAAGGVVVAIAEEATRGALARFGVALTAHPAKLEQAVGLGWRLRGVPYQAGTRVVAAYGNGRLERVRLADACGEREIACDALAVGHGLVPNTELAELVGCALDRSGRHPRVQVDALQKSSRTDVHVAGEATGIGGVDLALAEGRIAGHAAAGDLRRAVNALAARGFARHFARAVARHFPIPPDYARRLDAHTLVCRCEDVPWSALAGSSEHDAGADASWRARKLDTRCGMGWCQGRICGAALAALGADAGSGVRVPLFPTGLQSLIDAPD